MPDAPANEPPPPADPGENIDVPAKTAANQDAAQAAAPAEVQIADLNALLAQLLRQGNAANQPKDVWYFLSSGVFFMIVGAVALLAAFLTMGTTHASFTFVLVVVGVAILLYGTGTQGAGNFETVAGEMKYKIGVAGGAGILAFAVGIGIVEKSADIRDAFQIEKKYARLIFRDEGDGVGKLTDYVPEIYVNGLPVPSQRDGESIVALIPFLGQSGRSEHTDLGQFLLFRLGAEPQQTAAAEGRVAGESATRSRPDHHRRRRLRFSQAEKAGDGEARHRCNRQRH